MTNEHDGPASGERAALLAVLRYTENGAPPIPLWRLADSGLTAAELKAGLAALAARGCIRVTYRAGLVDAVTAVLPEAWTLGSQWAAGRS